MLLVLVSRSNFCLCSYKPTIGYRNAACTAVTTSLTLSYQLSVQSFQLHDILYMQPTQPDVVQNLGKEVDQYTLVTCIAQGHSVPCFNVPVAHILQAVITVKMLVLYAHRQVSLK